MRKNRIWLIDSITFQNVINESSLYSEMCSKLNLECTRSQVKMISYRIRVDGFDKTLFNHNHKLYCQKFKRIGYEEKLENILIKDSTYLSSNSLKKKLFKYNFLENKCQECGNIGSWNGKELKLQLDHINGSSNDNRLENLRILCPNCHTQTETFGSKRLKKMKIKKHLVQCKNCNKKSNGKLFCENCQSNIAIKNRKVLNRPKINILIEEVGKLGYVGTGKKYGVSDNTIRKWIK
jgi:hypothetical protein